MHKPIYIAAADRVVLLLEELGLCACGFHALIFINLDGRTRCVRCIEELDIPVISF